MLGAIAGDIIGSIYEARPIKTTEFPLFHRHSHPTDDTVLTIALADSILSGKDYVDNLKEYFYRYPEAGYGGAFAQWAISIRRAPYNSWGNGSAMRVSPVGFAYPSLDEVLARAKASAEVTHNHPEGIKGAQATAAAIFLARSGMPKAGIKAYLEQQFGYDLNESLDELRRHYRFDVSCQGTVPPALVAFLDSKDYEDAVRKAVSLGGDSDTLACITGGIAQAFYGSVPVHIKKKVIELLNEHFRSVVREFCARYQCE
ncbi:MAG TPA: ADP-ribosylglycohydrolase family protein [Gemmataceae bacterium]|jgi:ADP-ribosylglycohydrolase|nr:ADP-ribosylglycohydrolase family protein [Gemmataceae bacterium]